MRGAAKVVVITLVLMLLSTCGQGSHRDSSLSQTRHSPAALDLNAALAELGAMQVPQGADPAVFAQLKDSLRTALVARGKGKLVSTPPTGPANSVPDVAIADAGGGTADLSWHYYNLGDYNQDGTVGIADITPLAMHFGQTWVAGEENTLPCVVDGSGDGTVNIADVTPIAMNFGVDCAGYNVEECGTENGSYWLAFNFPLTNGLDKDTARMRFTTNIPAVQSHWYRVVPTDSGFTGGEPSVAAQYQVAGMPNAVIVPDVSSGFAPLVVTYDASGSTDPDGMIVKYEWDSDLDGVYEFDTGLTPSQGITYPTPSAYSMVVRVTDNDGLQDTAVASVTVNLSTWTHTWGWSSNDNFIDVTVTGSGGNYYTVGNTSNSGGAGLGDISICKYASDGTQVWARTWGGTDWDFAGGIDHDSSGNILVSGYTNSFGFVSADGFLLKLDSDGNLLWQKNFGTGDPEDCMDVVVDYSDNAYVVGSTSSGYPPDAYIAKFDSAGAMLWQYVWNIGGTERINSAVFDGFDDYVYMVGSVEGILPVSGTAALILKYDLDGNVLWAKAWDATGGETARSVAANGPTVFVSGITDSYGTGDTDVFTLAYDSVGDTVIERIWGGPLDDGAMKIWEYGGGYSYVAGWMNATATNSSLFVLRYDWLGNLLKQMQWQNDDKENAIAMTIGSDGGLCIVGSASNVNGDWLSISMAEKASTATMLTVIGQSGNAGFSVGDLPGALAPQIGVVDTGGGDMDALIMKVDTSAW